MTLGTRRILASSVMEHWRTPAHSDVDTDTPPQEGGWGVTPVTNVQTSPYCACAFSRAIAVHNLGQMPLHTHSSFVDSDRLFGVIIVLICFSQALGLAPNNSFVWHDLAVIYHLHGNYVSELHLKKQYKERALAAAKKSVSLNPRNWQHWNVLGVVATSEEIKNYSLAQHAFIKSVNIESSNPVSWTNLGTLYLLLGELKLANEAFIVTQRTEPSYIQCWIGQAPVVAGSIKALVIRANLQPMLVLESIIMLVLIRDFEGRYCGQIMNALLAERVKNEDSMDLFRHTTQLGIHPESCIGYSQFVCSTLLNTSNTTDPRFVYSIEKMYAIPVAVDAMTYYTAEICDNPCAYNMLGLLLERQRLYRGAAEAFESALNLLQSEENLSVRDKVLGNYGRVLVQLQRYDEAIKSYQQVKQANFYTQCGLALAYFKAEKYEDSYVAYETALEWLAPDDGFKSHVLVAMAAMTYMFQGVEDSKILLFQWTTVNISFPQPVPLALSSASLKPILLDGGREDERNGVASPPSKVSFRANKNKWITETVAGASYQTGLAEKSYDQSRSVEAVRSLSNTVHRHPGIPELWLSLALLLLLLDPTNKAAAAGKCAQRAMVLGRSSMDVTKVMSLVSLSHLLSGKATASLCSSQKAVHMFPDIPENWVVLVASFMPWCIHRRSSAVATWLKQLISHVRRKLESSRQMGKWLSNHERKVTILVEDFKRQD
uniref:Tetratricopeptide repeat protein 37 n=1 Tax=Timema tahoe TaxID=61484 RepID=A0A7R9IH54_9NEOP|nr:unnamed protein product [Timema tahoe]